jgi:hypothetical protein
MVRSGTHETLPVTVLSANTSSRRRSHIMLVWRLCKPAFDEILKRGGNNGSVSMQFSLLLLSFALFRHSCRASVETVKREKCQLFRLVLNPYCPTNTG